MLILVSASIIFMQNGHLIERAQEAKYKMQVEADKENLLSEVIAAYDVVSGRIDYNLLNKGINRIEFTGENGEYKSKSGNTFYVDEVNGTITLAKE